MLKEVDEEDHGTSQQMTCLVLFALTYLSSSTLLFYSSLIENKILTKFLRNISFEYSISQMINRAKALV